MYLHTRPDGTPFYVGKGSGQRSHAFFKNRSKYHKNIVLRYGAGKIGVCVFPCASEQNAFELEVIIIEVLRKAGHSLANLTDGGDGVSGYVFTKDDLAKMSAAHIGKTLPPEQRAKMSASRMGRVVSPETRAKLSKAHMGKKHSVEARANMSLARRGKPRKPWSPETRAKISAAHLKRKKQ